MINSVNIKMAFTSGGLEYISICLSNRLYLLL